LKIIINTRVLAHHLTGAQRYVLELTTRLVPPLERIEPNRPLAGIKGHLWEQFILPFLVKGAMLWSPSITGPLVLRRQVVTIFDVSPLDHPEWLSWKFAAWYRFLIPILVRRAQKIITISEFSKQRILAHTKSEPDKIVVIPCGVDPRFHPMPAERIEGNIANLELPSRRYLVSVGSLEPRKNLKSLLAGWAKARPSLPDDIWLVIAGAKGNSLVFSHETGVETLPPRVHLAGHVADQQLPALYAGAMGLAYLSLYEGFGLPPLEAMACGTPVLVSNTSSLPEVVGDCGYYADPLNIEDIARQIIALLTDRERSADYSLQGLERARLFSWDKVALQTLQILREAGATF